MVYQRGKQGLWWYRFRFGGRIVHESAKTASKTIARDAERARRRELEHKYVRVGVKGHQFCRFERHQRMWIGKGEHTSARLWGGVMQPAGRVGSNDSLQAIV